jgi:hypothetical protein
VSKAVHYSDTLIRALERSLQSAFNQPRIGLTKKPGQAGQEFNVRPQSGTSTAQLDNGSEQTVLEIITADGRESSFYFGFVATFVQAELGKYVLQNASLSIFHETPEDLMPIFRAEWDAIHASTKESIHAQPHWHFVDHLERIERVVRRRMQVPDEVVEFLPEQTGDLFSGLADYGKIHFAMTTLWDERDVPPPKRLFDSDEFPKWFAGLTNYVAGQIGYLVKKMPASAFEG